MVNKKKQRISIILQVAILFAIGICTSGIITYFVQERIAIQNVQKQTENLASQIADETTNALKQYTSYEWLIRYWYEHKDTLDIEYDVEYEGGTKTEAKCRELTERYPGLMLRYASESEIENLTPDDQKTYAEIIYSWLISDINLIKRSHHVSYLYCVLSAEPYDHQFFLFSGAEKGAKRGTDYEEVYILGTEVDVNESQQQAMRDAIANSAYLAEAGNYMDYYAYLCNMDEYAVLVGMTYDLSSLTEDIHIMTANLTTASMIQQVLLALICLGLIYFAVLKPLKAVQQNIRIYMETKDSDTIRKNLSEIINYNEIGELSDDVINLSSEIDDHLAEIEKITADRERVSAELALASRIQLASLPNIFPPFPDRKEFDIYALMDPAKEVGGDLYDFFMIDDDHLALIIADVSGKGVPSALYMMICLILIHTEAKKSLSPSEVLYQVNNQLCKRNPEQMFVSVWFGVLEISTGKLTAANAGHEYPILKKPDHSYHLFRDVHGFVIGGMEDVRYRDYEIMMKPGSSLFVYTDGLPEATDAKGKMFGVERILEGLNEDTELDPDHTIDHMRGKVDEFVNSAVQFDDMTMMCIRYNGCRKTEEES